VIQSRDRSQDATNKKAENRDEIEITRRQQIFENFIARESSQFEHVMMKTLNNEKIESKIERAINRVDSVSDRGRERERERERAREREFIIAVGIEENVISEADEEESKRRERERDRSRDRERRDRDREQAATSKET
jgi:hypothetical protein